MKNHLKGKVKLYLDLPMTLIMVNVPSFSHNLFVCSLAVLAVM